MRHVHRHLPGGRADFRRLPLQDASVGDEACRHDLHPLRRRMQDHAGRAPRRIQAWRSCAAIIATRAASMATSFASKAGTRFDFANNEDRLTQPLVRKGGRVGSGDMGRGVRSGGQDDSRAIRDREGGRAIGVIGSTRTTNEENYLLQKFARVVLKTNNIDHHRTADFPALRRRCTENQTPRLACAMCTTRRRFC